MTALSNDPLFPPRFGIFLKLEFPQERPYGPPRFGPPPFGPPVASETDPRASSPVPAAGAASAESPEASPRVPSHEASPSASPRVPSPEASPRAPSPEASIALSPEAEPLAARSSEGAHAVHASAVHESAVHESAPAVPERVERVERAESFLAAETTSDIRAATPSIAPGTAASAAAISAQHVSVPIAPATTEQPVPVPKAPVPNSAISAISAQQKLEIMGLSFGDLLRRKGAW